jgi:hypothetical protein
MRALAAMPADLTSSVTAMASLRARMVSYEDRTTAEQRRAEREPWHVNQLRLFLAAATSEVQQNAIHRKLTRARWDFFKTIAEQGAALRVARGGVVAKKRHLWLQAVIVSQEPLEICQSIPRCLHLGAEAFQAKWGGMQEHRSHLMHHLFEDKDMEFSETEIAKAIHACEKRSKLDHFGICSQALCYAVISHSHSWALFFSRLANDHQWLQCITVKGSLKAKAPPVKPENTRSILPQPVLLQVLHNLLCESVRLPLRTRVRQLGCANAIMGGTGGLQVMDLIQPAQAFLELAADNGSTWSMASGDIQQYYDMVPPEAIMQSMLLHGFDPCLSAFAAST